MVFLRAKRAFRAALPAISGVMEAYTADGPVGWRPPVARGWLYVVPCYPVCCDWLLATAQAAHAESERLQMKSI
jgi:hypothetical protein